jgi:ferritin-like metal-binding protein YciE
MAKASSTSAKKTSAAKAAPKKASRPTGPKPTGRTGKMADSEFHKFFVDELKDIYWAEKNLSKALPRMQKAATSDELKSAFEKHTAETLTHVDTLEKVFASLEEKAVAKKCDAMAGLLEEAKGIIEETEKGTMIRDAGLILAAQKVEHYEIATYGTLVTFAECMGHTEVADMLRGTLENEKATDQALTGIAEDSINDQAAEE